MMEEILKFNMELERREKNGEITKGTRLNYQHVLNKFISFKPQTHNWVDKERYYHEKEFEEYNRFDLPEKYNQFLVKYTRTKKYLPYYNATMRLFVNTIFKDNKSKRTSILAAFPKPKDTRLKEDTPKLNRKKLNPKEVLNLIGGLKKDKHKIIAHVQACTGARVGDVLRLRRDDIVEEAYKDKPSLKLYMTGKRNKKSIAYIHIGWLAKDILDFINKNDFETGYCFLETKFEGSHKPTTGVKISPGIGTDVEKILIKDDNIIKGVEAGEYIWMKDVQYQSKKKLIEYLKPFCLKGTAKKYYKKVVVINDYHKLTRLNYNCYWRDLQETVVRMGIGLNKFSTHDFRRCYADAVWKDEKDISKLKKQLNHTRVDTTLLYLKSSDDERQEVDYILQEKVLGF